MENINVDEQNQITRNADNVRQLMRSTAQAEKGNRFYDSNNKMYMRWIDNHQHRAQLGLQAGQYFSETALNTYFLEVVS